MARKLLDVTLHGLPELEYFSTPVDRQKAIDEIGAEAGNPKSPGFWLAIGLLVATALLARWAAGLLLSFVLWPRWLEDVLHTAAMVVAFVAVLRWLHRSDAATELRKKLLAGGVPVCMACGYLLRGLSVMTKRCPECGAEFSPRACELLRQESNG